MPKQIRQQKTLELTAEQPVFSVSAFLDYVNEMLNLQNVQVQGEVSSWKIHPTGIYFCIKDEGGVLDCYMSPYVYRGLGLNVEDGMMIKIGGIPSIYKPKGRFSFRVESMELVGEGSLKKAYELLKAKLQSEGLYDRKRALPEFIHRIGVVTSRTGAVIDDFRKNLKARGHEVYLYDVRVEGAKAVNLVSNAVRWFNSSMPDLDILVIMRGGGSLEDLQAFNHELVCREVFASKIPTICAIGHDRDVPIMCLVGDAATSTPTAAATLINGSWDRAQQQVPQHAQALSHAFESVLADIKTKLDVAMITQSYEHLMEMVQQRLVSARAYLESVNPERNLALGYSILRDTKGKVIKSIQKVKKGDRIDARLADGSISTEVL